MRRGGKLAGMRKPHILFRNGLYRCYTLIWDGRSTTGCRIGLGHTLEDAYNRWLDGGIQDSGRLLYALKL